MNRKLCSLRRAAWAAGALLAVISPVWGQSIGDCVTVNVPAPIILPDGSTHPAGKLTICLTKHGPFSLHKTSVGGKTIGMLRSRRGRSEGEARRHPFVLFHKNERGEFRLIGYAWPDGRRMATYQLAEPVRRTDLVARRTAGRGSTVALDLRGYESVILRAGSLD